MANVQKYTKGAIGHLFKHYERAKDENGEYLKFGNQEIDETWTAENYNLAPAREISQGEFVRQRCSEVKCLNRANVNVMCSWVLTAPQSIAGDPQAEKLFFKEGNKSIDELKRGTAQQELAEGKKDTEGIERSPEKD